MLKGAGSTDPPNRASSIYTLDSVKPEYPRECRGVHKKVHDSPPINQTKIGFSLWKKYPFLRNVKHTAGFPPSGKIRESQGEFYFSGKSGKIREFNLFFKI